MSDCGHGWVAQRADGVRARCGGPGLCHACWNDLDEQRKDAGMSRPQPLPVHNQRVPVWELVVLDMMARDRSGRKKYGTPLQAFNGRDALVDAYQEVLDAAVYLRQAIEERDLAQQEAKDAVGAIHNSGQAAQPEPIVPGGPLAIQEKP